MFGEQSPLLLSQELSAGPWCSIRGLEIVALDGMYTLPLSYEFTIELTGVIIAAFTAALVVCTFYLARVTKVLAAETRKMRELQTAPRFDIRIESNNTGNQQLELIMRNEGHGPARNVRISFEGDASYYRNTFLGPNVPPIVPDLPLIRKGIIFVGSRPNIPIPNWNGQRRGF